MVSPEQIKLVSKTLLLFQVDNHASDVSSSAHESGSRAVGIQVGSQPFQSPANDHDDDDQATLSMIAGENY